MTPIVINTNSRKLQDTLAWKLRSMEHLSNDYILEHINQLDANLLLKNKRLNLTDELKLLLQLKLL